MYGKFYSNVSEFYDLCYSFLLKHEAENNLIFGILDALKVDIHAYDPTHDPVLILIYDNSEIVLVSIRTPPYNQIISLTSNLKSIPVLVDLLIRNNHEISGILGFKKGAQVFNERWKVKKGKKSVLYMNERSYQLKEVNRDIQDRHLFESASEEDKELLISWGKEFIKEIHVNAPHEQILRNIQRMEVIIPKSIQRKDVFVLKASGTIVSIARTSRGTPNGQAITLVYTPPHFRYQGYATELVAKLCNLVLKSGKKFCYLFTDLANPTSNSVYMKIGFQPVIDVDEYRFE